MTYRRNQYGTLQIRPTSPLGYSSPYNFNSIAVSGYKVDWKQIGLSPVELDIIESEKWI